MKQTIWHDAGQSAAKEQFGVSMGEIASVFLGSGDWEPEPKTWREKKETSPSSK